MLHGAGLRPRERPPHRPHGRSGAAAKAGHDLLIEVTAWSGTLDPDGDPAVTLSADPRSLRVLEGTGGMQPLDDEARAGIEQTIDDEVLKGTTIEFRSTRFDGLPGRVEGELELAGGAARSASSWPSARTEGSPEGRSSGRAIGA